MLDNNQTLSFEKLEQVQQYLQLQAKQPILRYTPCGNGGGRHMASKTYVRGYVVVGPTGLHSSYAVYRCNYCGVQETVRRK